MLLLSRGHLSFFYREWIRAQPAILFVVNFFLHCVICIIHVWLHTQTKQELDYARKNPSLSLDFIEIPPEISPGLRFDNSSVQHGAISPSASQEALDADTGQRLSDPRGGNSCAIPKGFISWNGHQVGGIVRQDLTQNVQGRAWGEPLGVKLMNDHTWQQMILVFPTRKLETYFADDEEEVL